MSLTVCVPVQSVSHSHTDTHTHTHTHTQTHTQLRAHNPLSLWRSHAMHSWRSTRSSWFLWSQTESDNLSSTEVYLFFFSHSSTACVVLWSLGSTLYQGQDCEELALALALPFLSWCLRPLKAKCVIGHISILFLLAYLVWCCAHVFVHHSELVWSWART